jgi:hypothetical protein
VLSAWLESNQHGEIKSVAEFHSAVLATRAWLILLTGSSVSRFPIRFRCDPSLFSSFRELAVAEFEKMWEETLTLTLEHLNTRAAEHAKRDETVYLLVAYNNHSVRAGRLPSDLYTRVTTVVPTVASSQAAGVYAVPAVVADALVCNHGSAVMMVLPECNAELAELVTGLMETGTENFGIAKWVSTASNLLGVSA